MPKAKEQLGEAHGHLTRFGFGRGKHVDKEAGHPAKTIDHVTHAIGAGFQAEKTIVSVPTVFFKEQTKGVVVTALLEAGLITAEHFLHTPGLTSAAVDVAAGLLSESVTQVNAVRRSWKAFTHGIEKVDEALGHGVAGVKSAGETHRWFRRRARGLKNSLQRPQ